MYLSMVPPTRWISWERVLKYPPRIARSSSGSRRSPRAVDPERSAIITVLMLRTSAIFGVVAVLRPSILAIAQLYRWGPAKKLGQKAVWTARIGRSYASFAQGEGWNG